MAAVAITEHRHAIERQLEEIERRTEKKHQDSYTCEPKRLRRYLEEALAIEELSRAVHFRVYEQIKRRDYQGYGIATALDVADLFQPVSNAVFVPEGFTSAMRDRFSGEARKRFVRTEVWSGNFDGCSLVRFADAVAGLIGRDRFKKKSRKYFPDLANPSFVELKELKTNPPAVCR